MAALPSHPFGASLGLAAGLTAVLVHGAGAGSELGSCSVCTVISTGAVSCSPRVCSGPAGEPQAAPGWICSSQTPWIRFPEPGTSSLCICLAWSPERNVGSLCKGFPPELVWCGEHRASPAADSQARVVPLAVEMSGKPLQAGRQAVSLLRAGASHGCAVCAALAHSCASSGLGSGLTMVLSHAGEGQHSTAVGSSSLGAPFPSASVIFTALCYDDVCFFPSFLLSLFLSLSFSLSVSLIFFCFLRIIFGQRQ